MSDSEPNEADTRGSMVKIVYFDEESASDYLDITAGGKSKTTSEQVRQRSSDVNAKVATSVAAKLSWLPFIGASAETSGGVNWSGIGKSILSKTLSNTILTDYLDQVEDDSRIKRLSNLRVTAPENSMAFMKMYTPYMVIAKSEGSEVDLARLDEALTGAKGYYELLGEESTAGNKCVLRFNIKAFRNNYGLTDLGRMRLTFHGILVGQTSEDALGMEAEMNEKSESTPITALDLIDGATKAEKLMLDVYDVILAGVYVDE